MEIEDERSAGADHSMSSEMDTMMESHFRGSSLADQLERCGRWLSSIPRDDVIDLRETPEYHDFLRSFERLGQAHRRVVSANRNSAQVAPVHETYWSISNNFLQYLTADDVILRIFEFLECQSLIRMAFTCSRFRQLAYRSATQRTCDVMSTRQLRSVMQLLRAKEQIDGVGTSIQDNHVRVPLLLLNRRILVTRSGDPEYNGVYFCTGCNGNGFVFTKPRYPERRVRRLKPTESRDTDSPEPPGPMEEEGVLVRPDPPGEAAGDAEVAAAAAAAAAVPLQNVQGPIVQGPVGETPSARFESDDAQPGGLLRCVIAKRFSHEMILWYLSKELDSSETQQYGIAPIAPGEVTQVFSFWAKLMVIGDASPDICRYPSQSSILGHHQEQWNSLATNRNPTPPIVELLD
eukprot:scaffold11680_cov142-Cylindrotheca_fusiformis.AAC.8